MGDRGPAAGSGKKGAPTAIRFAPGLKQRLQAAAAAEGRTFSHEVEERLERSFADDAVKTGGSNTWLLWGLRMVIDAVEADTAQSWRTDGFTRDVIAENLRSFMRRQGPEVENAPPPESFPAWFPDGPPSSAQEKRDMAAMMVKGIGERFAYQVNHNMKAPFPETLGDFARAQLEAALADARIVGQRLTPAKGDPK
jgi:hypothetical protein